MKKRILELINKSGVKCDGKEHKNGMIDRVIDMYYVANDDFEGRKDELQRALMVIRAVQSGAEKIEVACSGDEVFDEKMAAKAGCVLINEAKRISGRFSGGMAGEFLKVVANESVGSSVTASSIYDICVRHTADITGRAVTASSGNEAIRSGFEKLVSMIAENEDLFFYECAWDLVTLIMDAAYIYR